MNQRPFSVLLLVLLALTPIGSVRFQIKEPTLSSLSPEDTAMVYFKTPIELESAINIANQYGLVVQAFQREYQMGSQTVVDGYFLPSANIDPSTLTGLYWQSYGDMLEDIEQATANIPMANDPLVETARQMYLDDVKKARQVFSFTLDGCWATNTCSSIAVMELLVSGKASDLSNLAISNLVDRIEFQGNSEEQTNTTTITIQATVPINTWVPKSGYIVIGENSRPRGQCYISNYMIWDTASRISGFGTNSTYEHDFFLNNSSNSTYGPGTYLTGAQYANGIPKISHWSSNLPRPYLDTRFGDAGYLKAFTIGSADAHKIKYGVLYQNYIRASKGTASIDNGFLQAQLGRTPSTCYTTWCSFGDQHHDIYSPYQVDPIPSGIFYWP